MIQVFGGKCSFFFQLMIQWIQLNCQMEDPIVWFLDRAFGPRRSKLETPRNRARPCRTTCFQTGGWAPKFGIRKTSGFYVIFGLKMVKKEKTIAKSVCFQNGFERDCSTPFLKRDGTEIRINIDLFKVRPSRRDEPWLMASMVSPPKKRLVQEGQNGHPMFFVVMGW